MKLTEIFKNAEKDDGSDSVVPQELGTGSRKTHLKMEAWLKYPKFLQMLGKLYKLKPGLSFDKRWEINPALAEACPFLEARGVVVRRTL